VTIGDDEVDLRRSARAEVFEDTHPPVFALLGASTQRQHLFVPGHVHAQGRQDHRRVGLLSVPHTEMDAIQIQDAEVELAGGARAKR
jgi:hypothetical protein